LVASAASSSSSADGSAGITAMKPLIESTTGWITGTGRARSANNSHAAASRASALPSASAIGAFSVA
jgi:hypothetical protein